MKVYVTEQLGPNQSKTPEGFLLCEEATIARTGVQIYGAYEIPVPLGPDGKIEIERDESEVFRQETIDSFAGKAVTINHPEEDVTPKNWHQLSVGTVLNPRRGISDKSHLLIADLLITDQAAIDLIESKEVRELSCGYDAKYEVFEPGRGRQFNIVGNHVALVPKARCGAECSIQDHATVDCCGEEETQMTLKERLKKAFGITDEKKLEEILAESTESATKTETHVHLHTRDEEKEEEDDKDKDDDKDKKTHDAIRDAVADAVKPIKDSIDSLDARLKKFEDEADEEKEDDKDDDKDDEEKTKDAIRVEIPLTPKVRTKDSKLLEDAYQETLALAEVISPGVAAPVFDSAQPAAKTAESLCGFRRKVLDKAAADQPEVKQFMDGALGGRDFKTYDCAGVRSVFLAVGAYKKQANNGVRDALPTFGTETGSVRSLADLNKQNEKFYSAHKA